MNRATSAITLTALGGLAILTLIEPPLWVLALVAAAAWTVAIVTYRLETRPRYRRRGGAR